MTDMTCSKCGKKGLKTYYSGLCPSCYYTDTDVSSICSSCNQKIRLYKIKENLCRACYHKKYFKKYYESHKEKMKTDASVYYYNNKEKCLLSMEQYNDDNKEHIKLYRKEYHLKNREKHLESMRQWYRTNGKKMNKKAWEKRKYRLETDTQYYIKDRLSSRIRMAIMNQGGEKTARTIELLGADIDTVRKHIESQFKPGMTWENHGITTWHIDHIIPCYTFDLTKEEEQKKCFYYLNLQPLWYDVNIRKDKNKQKGFSDGDKEHKDR